MTPIPEDCLMLKSLIRLRIAEYEVRTGKRFKKKDAAAKLDMSPQHFSAIINGAQQTTPEKLFMLAQLLECKVDDLYEYKEE